MFGRIGEGIVTCFFLCVAAAAVVGGLIVWLAPKAWHWIVPIIHAATA